MAKNPGSRESDFGRLNRILGNLTSEEDMREAAYGAIPHGVGLSHLSLVLSEDGWNYRLDSFEHLKDIFQKLREDDELSPGGLIVFSPDIDYGKPLARKIFGRVGNWLRRTVPELVPFLGKTASDRAMKAIQRAGGVGASTMRLGDAAKLGLVFVPAEGLWGDPDTGETFNESSLVVWIAGVTKDELEKMAKEIKAEFHQKAVMYVPLDTRIVKFV